MRSSTFALASLALMVAPLPTRGDGASVYKASCALCHGSGPSPHFAGRSVEDVKRVIKSGKGKMAPVSLSPTDAEEVAAFTAFEARRAAAPVPPPRSTAEVTTKIGQGDQLVGKDDRAALFAYLDAIALDPVSVPARLKLAAQYARMRHPDFAARQWEFVLGVEPLNEEANRMLRASATTPDVRPAASTTSAPPAPR